MGERLMATLYRFVGLASCTFALFLSLGFFAPVWGRIVALLVITAACCPMFLAGDEDNPNPNGGVFALVVLVAIGSLALMVGGA
jgi:hypothetical protein